MPTITIESLFKYSLSISCDKKKRALQDIAFKHQHIPLPTTFNAITPENLNNTALQSDLMKQFLSFKDETDNYKDTIVENNRKLWPYLALSTQMAIFYAKSKNWPYVLIFEDDAWPNKNIKTELQNYVNELNSLFTIHENIDVVVLGFNKEYNANAPKKKYKFFNFFEDNATIIGSQSYIVPSSSYDKLLKTHIIPSDYLINTCRTKAIVNSFNSMWFCQFQHDGWRQTKSISAASNYKKCYIYWRKYSEIPFEKNMLPFEELNLPKSYDEYNKQITYLSNNTKDKKFEIGKKLLQLFDIICIVMTTRPKIKNTTLKMLQSIGVLTEENIISGKVHIQYDMPNVTREIIKKNIPKLNIYNKDDKCFAVTLNHYYALAAAYHSGVKTALVFEDDSILLKDSDKVLNYLNDIPKNWDFVNFGCLPTGGPNGIQNFKDMLSANSGTSLYAILQNGRNAHAFGMSRKFMEKMLNKIEARMLGKDDAELLVNDQWFNHRIFNDCNMWFSRKPLFVQQWDETCKNRKANYDLYYKLYPDCKKEDYI